MGEDRRVHSSMGIGNSTPAKVDPVAMEKVKDIVKGAALVVFSKSYCPFCTRGKGDVAMLRTAEVVQDPVVGTRGAPRDVRKADHVQRRSEKPLPTDRSQGSRLRARSNAYVRRET
eukprot:scaffold287_cov337-Pavlova_lutheri.AAC.52